MKKAWLIFFLLVMTFILLLEVFARYQSDTLKSLSDRSTLKEQMFLHRKQTDVLFIGSSMLKDGVSPDFVSADYENRNGKKLSGFNGASTGTNLAKLSHFVETVIGKEGLRYLFIELSRPQIGEGSLDDAEENVTFEDTIEGKLQQLAYDNLYIVKRREAFRIEVLARIFAIWAADYFEGSDLFRIHFFFEEKAEILKSIPDDAYWSPKKLPQLNLSKEDSAEFKGVMRAYKEIGHLAKSHNVKVVILLPPTSKKVEPKECAHSTTSLYSTIIHENEFDYIYLTCNQIPEHYFWDKKIHLSQTGSMIYSLIISHTLSELETVHAL